MDKCSGYGSSNILDCDDILREILSRLPVKSLARFKCVNKLWQFTICQDQGFIELHFTRSKQSCPDLFIVVPRHDDKLDHYDEGDQYKQSFLLANLFESTTLPTSNRITLRKSEQKPFHYTDILNTVNGLICFVDRTVSSVCILNPSTRERTPWIASSLHENNKKNSSIAESSSSYFFGFDPATKQHKVVCMWRIRKSVKAICEVLTVGDNTWRRIDEKVPFVYRVKVSVYSKGFVYWGDKSVGIPTYINAFDVGCEKFKVIEVPKEIGEKCKSLPGGNNYYGPADSLMEVGGHIALLHRWTSNVVKLWICDDDDTSTNGSYSKWNEVTMELPFEWGGTGRHGRLAYFHGVAGEDRIIIQSYPYTMHKFLDIKEVSLYSYDWRKNASRKAKSGVVSELVSVSLFSELAYVSLFRSFAESLWPVQLRHNQEMSNSSLKGKHPHCDGKGDAPSGNDVKKSKTTLSNKATCEIVAHNDHVEVLEDAITSLEFEINSLEVGVRCWQVGVEANARFRMIDASAKADAIENMLATKKIELRAKEAELAAAQG
ncbi:hypothetical protein MKW94_007983 [Papaver nudicaule]|uniref:F-box domain-containing protein n=1 Tax=Papaver nudicaule TaxID=74823 RepID=A0AA41V679_PAPNU|nr:hypothetical protein [Papaver nudicaule]